VHALRSAGYETATSRRMHFIEDDHLHGFENHIYPDETIISSKEIRNTEIIDLLRWGV